MRLFRNRSFGPALFQAGQSPVRSFGLIQGYTSFASALFDRLSVKPSNSRLNKMNTLFRSLENHGIIEHMDALYLMVAHNEQAACLNWIQDAYDLTPMNGPTFAVDQGYTGNGSSTYLDTGFNPATAVGAKFSQNSGHLSVWSNTSAQGSGNQVEIGNANSTIQCRNNLNEARHRLNSGTSGGVGDITEGKGLYVTSRTGPLSSDNKLYKNGELILSDSSLSQAPDSSSIFILGRTGSLQATSYSSRQVSVASIGGGLTQQQVIDFSTALSIYTLRMFLTIR